MRQLVNNMVLGVSKGFEKKLSLIGGPWRRLRPQAEPERSVSHPVNFGMPCRHHRGP